MNESGKSALLVGASGLVGGQCLRLLLEGNKYSHVIVLGRRKVQLEHPKLVQFEVDFENLPDGDEQFEADDVYCCLGTTIAKAGSKEAFARVDRDYPLRVGQRAVKHGAKQYLLVSSVGAHPASSNFYLRTKGEVEREISEVPFHAVHIFRPSMLLGKREEFRWKEMLFEPLIRAASGMLARSLRRYRPIEARDVARAMLVAAGGEGSGVKIYEGQELERLVGN